MRVGVQFNRERNGEGVSRLKKCAGTACFRVLGYICCRKENFECGASECIDLSLRTGILGVACKLDIEEA